MGHTQAAFAAREQIKYSGVETALQETHSQLAHSRRRTQRGLGFNPFTMSHFGRGGGYPLTSERSAFHAQVLAREQRARELDLLSPRSSPRFMNPGIAPGLRNPVAHLPVDGAITARPSPRLMGGASPRSMSGASPRLPQGMSVPLSPRTVAELRPPAISTTAQLAFAAHDPAFLDRFRERSVHGKPHDVNTEYREKVFAMWNVTGVKNPASFR